MINPKTELFASSPEVRKFLSMAALAGALICMHSCSNPAKNNLNLSGKEDFADSAQSSVHLYKDAQGRKVLQRNNTDYDVVDFIDRNDLKKVLLRITRSETSLVDSGTSVGHFMVSVSNIGDSKSGWSKDINGTDVDYSNKVLVVHTEGKNSNEEDTYVQYSLLTGEKLMAYTYGQLLVLIPSTSHKRFFGYLSKESATADKPEGIGEISYVGSDHVIDRIRIKLKGNDPIPIYTPELKMLVAQDSGNSVINEGRTVVLGHAGRTFSPSDVSNFAMQINYFLPGVQDPVTVLLPVRDDRLDLTNAAYDRKIFEISKAE